MHPFKFSFLLLLVSLLMVTAFPFGHFPGMGEESRYVQEEIRLFNKYIRELMKELEHPRHPGGRGPQNSTTPADEITTVTTTNGTGTDTITTTTTTMPTVMPTIPTTAESD